MRGMKMKDEEEEEDRRREVGKNLGFFVLARTCLLLTLSYLALPRINEISTFLAPQRTGGSK